MFDANGNQQIVVEPNADRTTTTWDYENLTTRVALPFGTVATYTWNGHSHHITKNVDGIEGNLCQVNRLPSLCLAPCPIDSPTD